MKAQHLSLGARGPGRYTVESPKPCDYRLIERATGKEVGRFTSMCDLARAERKLLFDPSPA